ncbi:DUF4097 family beta strand repeat-containing protein [Acidicapsa dinghuensis]|uniref:DUF4097 family beta strand repeat-containing protein n=1 Tax=Acidicapsa dinghuensis TaxID=2218256 RepID=A0ABW1EB72_9BACT|nr:DUF4097 family beta strand repeat-containing protein [Acidicapsa dinghuensis]
MATIPPSGNPPSGGAPPPGGYPPGRPPYGGPQYGAPYGASPKDYWRFQKEQSRAAWRAQRSVWRAQRDVLRAQNRSMRVPSIAGPIVLIMIGVIALLLMTGRLNADQFWTWYGHWWPLMLIGIGIVALAEWAIDLRRDNPPYRRFGSYGGIIVFLVFIGIASAGWHHFWGPIRAQFGDNDDDFFSLGEPQHQMDQSVIDTKVPANAQITVQVPRGDVSITAADGDNVSVKAHQIAFASTDEGAKRIFDAQQAHVTVSGNAVVVKVDGNPSGRTNLIISIPKSASINVTADHGGVTAAGLGGDIDAEVQHGDMEATAIHGHVHAHMANHADFAAHDISGDVTVEGNGSDLTISDIHGKVNLQGEYSGDIHLERIDQDILFHSSRTDMGFARLPGDMSMTLDSLHITQVAGPIHIETHSKDIEMSQVYGDTNIEDRDGRVELDMAGAYQVEVKNNKGDVEVSLPPGVNQTVDMRTHNGDIVSDFPLQITGDENKTMTGNVGNGGPRLVLSTEHADLGLHKGDVAGPLPAVAPRVPGAPPSPKVPHLKASKSEATPTPVSQ